MRSISSLVAVLSLITACASSERGSSTKGGREIGGMPPAPNVIFFQLKTPSDLPARQTPELAPVFAAITKGTANNTICAYRQLQTPLGKGGKVVPSVKITFASYGEMRNVNDELKALLDATKVVSFFGTAEDCRAQVGDNGALTRLTFESLIALMQNAGIQASSTGGVHPTSTWTSSLTCSQSASDQSNTPFPRPNISCVFGEGSEQKPIAKFQDAELATEILQAAGIEAQHSNPTGTRVVFTWSASSVTCTQSTMEIVAPGGAGFSQRTISECSVK